MVVYGELAPLPQEGLGFAWILADPVLKDLDFYAQ